MDIEGKISFICLLLYGIAVSMPKGVTAECGCKQLRPCYQEMLDTLLDRDEVPCIEDAAIGLSTLTVFLKAIKTFCHEVFELIEDDMTFEGRTLYEVHLLTKEQIELKGRQENSEELPIFLIEAGQEGGSESVMLALYVIEQLVACKEYEEMIKNVKWIILPCTNPDGQEYSRFSRIPWKKNLKPSDEDASFGVDLTRNFDSKWDACYQGECGFSQTYPGPSAESEKETKFITKVISKYIRNINIYLSIKRDGHSINYPYAVSSKSPKDLDQLSKIAGDVTAKVNQRAGSVHLFSNNSLFELEGKSHCGHSVDYAYDVGITLSYEMRVFLGSDNHIMSKFQALPRGYENSLRNGYFIGIRELYNAIKHQQYIKE